MPAQVLLIEVGLLDNRWHGVGDWPPSPFRLFQALVAGAYGGRWSAEDSTEKDAAFRWLELLDPPVIAAPPRKGARSVTHFVPNNDLDAAGGDPARTAEIRSAKVVQPILLEKRASFLYAWNFDQGGAQAVSLCTYAERLHTFGRGIDAAFAGAEVVDAGATEARLFAHGGPVSRPTGGERGGKLSPCPVEGSLDSLKARHAATAARFETEAQGRGRVILFRQPPKASARPIAYDSPPVRLVYDLRRSDDPRRFRSVPQTSALGLTEAVRDGAAQRLSFALPDAVPLVDRFLRGHGATGADVDRRVRITPIPSIGFEHTSPSIRRVAVEVPPDCPLRPRDLAWAFAGLSPPSFEIVDGDTGEVVETLLTPAEDLSMLRHYGFDAPHRRWRSVTSVALPHPLGRARSGGERAAAEARAAGALAAALRHAGVKARPLQVRVQREPFHGKGEPADAFEPGRFAGRLRHLEVLFETPISGPLVIGDGRFSGLGLMRPVKEPLPRLHLFAVAAETAPRVERAEAVARALRRAVMALAQHAIGRGELPRMFSGHEPDGAPARSGHHEHLFFAAYANDGGRRIDRLAVLAPSLADRTSKDRNADLELLAKALSGLRTLRAGPDGVLALTPVSPSNSPDGAFGTGRVWIDRTPYRPTRHPARRQSPETAVIEDLLGECARRGLPRPEVEILELTEGPRGSLTARLRLTFAVEVAGPLLLGRGSHFGAGLFRPVR